MDWSLFWTIVIQSVIGGFVFMVAAFPVVVIIRMVAVAIKSPTVTQKRIKD